MKFQPTNIRNPLKSDSFFNRYEATKDRSPRFRAFVILLLLVFGFIMVYGLRFNKSTSVKANRVLEPSIATSK